MKNLFSVLLLTCLLLSCQKDDVDFSSEILGVWLPVSDQADFCDNPNNAYSIFYDINGCIQTNASITCDFIEFEADGGFSRSSTWTSINGQTVPSVRTGTYGLSGNSLTIQQISIVSGTVLISGNELSFSYWDNGFNCNIRERYRRQE